MGKGASVHSLIDRDELFLSHRIVPKNERKEVDGAMKY